MVMSRSLLAVERGQVVEFLLRVGADPDELAEAERTEMLLALLADRFLLPGERTYDLARAAEKAGISTVLAGRLWRSMGFADPEPGERILREDDVEIMDVLTRGGGEVSDYVIHEARVINSALTRIAEVLVDEMWDQHVEGGRDQHEVAAEVAEDFDLHRLERLVLWAFRRQLVAAVTRRCALSATDQSAFPTQAIGFADLVGFTELSAGLDENELARQVTVFEAASHDVLASLNVRLVKMIGDEVMFAGPDAARVARAALTLVREIESRSTLPALRVVLAAGPVIAREGDFFGPVVRACQIVCVSA
jgi:adenylate cyclase